MPDYEKTGVLSLEDLKIPTEKQLEKGVAILECVQEIPCNPCVDACPVNAISMENINAPPVNDYEKCIGCAKCVGVCPGLAIFVVKIKNAKAFITMQYEFLPVPKVGDKVKALNRKGENVTEAVVRRVVKQDKTMVITVELDKDFAMDVRNIRV
ncbi:MAG: 4Fe-4S binding protein [Candidatus Thermoplasmatota archaeon]|jgi:Fe-S-cluster-containing hydrogenase component 2|nr:4Fe-4S binding protein [Candidatus Thermoplasmatota archaeon]